MNRSAGVTVIAVLAMIGSALTLGIAVLATIGLLAGAGQPPKDFPASPMFFRAIMLMVPLFYALVAAWGITTGVGLLQLKNWARISTVVFSVLLILFGAFGALGSLAIFLAPPPSDLDQHALAFVRAFMVLFAVGQTGVGVWWLVFFNRPRVKEQFVARQISAGYPPIQAPYPVQPSYHVQPPPGVSVPIAPTEPRRPLSLSIIAWIMLVIAAFFPVNIALHTPAILLVKVLTGWQAALVMSVYEVLIIFIGVGLLRLKPAARYVGIAYFVFSVLNTVVFNFAPGGQSRVMKLLEAQRSTFPWMRDTPDVYQQLNSTTFFLMVSLMGLIFSLVPLYFLIKEKQAFEKDAGHVA
jgi:hypothetical protein